MPLILTVTIVLAVSSTLVWLGFCVGTRALSGARARQSRWIIGSTAIAAAWLVGVSLLASVGVLPPRIPVALGATLLVGYLLLLSPTFRRIIAAVPQHWRCACVVQRQALRANRRGHIWNIFGMADLVNAVGLGKLTNGDADGILFPLVFIPVYGLPRSLLIDAYSPIGLLRKTSEQPRHAESLHYRTEAAGA